MTEARLYNVYCDESCHLEHDGVPVMAWGAVTCPESEVRAIAEASRRIKEEFDNGRHYCELHGKPIFARRIYCDALIPRRCAGITNMRFQGER